MERYFDTGYSLPIFIRIVKEVVKNLFKERISKDFRTILLYVQNN